jgi:hypothetical protein
LSFYQGCGFRRVPVEGYGVGGALRCVDVDVGQAQAALERALVETDGLGLVVQDDRRTAIDPAAGGDDDLVVVPVGEETPAERA